MIDPDVSERECVGEGDDSDASDAFQAGEDDAKRHAAESQRGHRTPTKKGDSRMRERAAARPSEERAEGRAALLDRLSPSLPGDPLAQDPHAGEEPAEPFECAFAGIVHRALWPIVEAARHTELVLIRLSFSTPREETLLADGARFVAEVGQRPGEGVLLARDVGPVHGRGHFYGPALIRDPARLCERWRDLTGASAKQTERIIPTGWPDNVPVAYGHFGIVLAYTFKPWPDGFGRRSFTRDVLAAGVMTAPWAAARAILEGSPDLDPDRPGKASANGRKCQRCGRPMPARKRAHAQWCSKQCKGAAYEDRHPGRKLGPPRTPGGSPDDSE